MHFFLIFMSVANSKSSKLLSLNLTFFPIHHQQSLALSPLKQIKLNKQPCSMVELPQKKAL